MKKGRKKNGVGRPFTGETKSRALYSISIGILAEFRRHCKRRKINMSNWIEKQMHQFNIENAEV